MFGTNRVKVLIACTFVATVSILLFLYPIHTDSPNGRLPFNGHISKQPQAYDGTVVEGEKVLFDGTTKFSRFIAGATPELIFLLLTKDEESWGQDRYVPRRTLHDFFDLLVATKLDLTTVSLGIQTASETEYVALRAATELLPFARLTILYRGEDAGGSREDRHDPDIQEGRRSKISILRNDLMLRSLDDEKHIIWLDSDIAYLSDGIVQKMIHQAETHDEVGILTARCQHRKNPDYDWNAWVAAPQSPAEQDDEISLAYDKFVETEKHIISLIGGTTDDDIVPLDSVGGTILYMRSSLVFSGLNFPYIDVVGTRWNRLGYIGIETEGLCYMSRTLKSGGCYVLGGNHHVRHSDF